MKTIFLPAIKFFNKLNLLFKFLCISTILLLLLGVAAYQYFSSVDSYINFNSKEVIGAEYSKVSKSLMMDFLIYRDSVSSNKNDMTNEANNIDNTLKQLKSLNKKDKNILDNKASQKEVSTDTAQCYNTWMKLKNNQNKTYVDFDNMFLLITKLHSDISDNSNLTLDPDLDSYYCMDIVMFRSLSLFKNLYDLKSITEPINSQSIPTDNSKQIIVLSTQITNLSDTILSDMETAISFNNSKKVKIFTSMKENIIQFDGSMNDLKNKMDSISNQNNNIQLIETMNTCIKLNSSMYDNINTKLLELLNIRVNRYKNNKNTFIFLLILAIPSYFIFISPLCYQLQKPSKRLIPD